MSEAREPARKAISIHIVGQVEIVDCVTSHSSPWFQGQYGFVLKSPVVFGKPWPAKGSLGLFSIHGDKL